jgi:CRISPR/Cas system-associated exonuclease Cas4 (RecB family)
LVWNTDLERIRGDLRGWLRYVALTETEWTPALFELEFDKVEIAPRRLLQGRIDLIEEHAGGALRITDHKTGRPPEENRIPQQIGGGEFLQPVLYAMAASAKLGKPVAGARLFYATLRGNYTVLPIRLAPETRESAEMVLDAIDKAIRNADMPAAPRAEACEYCDYLPVCGPYEELRVGLKSRRPELHQIRSVR